MAPSGAFVVGEPAGGLVGHSSRPTSEVLEELVGGVRSIGSKILDTRTVMSGSSEYTRPYNTWSFKNILKYQYGSAEYPIWIIMIGSILGLIFLGYTSYREMLMRQKQGGMAKNIILQRGR